MWQCECCRNGRAEPDRRRLPADHCSLLCPLLLSVTTRTQHGTSGRGLTVSTDNCSHSVLLLVSHTALLCLSLPHKAVSIAMSVSDAPLAPAFDAPPAHQLVVDSELYMRAHPELSSLLTDFTCAALQARPDDVSQFAANYFAPLQPGTTAATAAAGQGLSARMASGTSPRPTHRSQQSSVAVTPQ